MRSNGELTAYGRDGKVLAKFIGQRGDSNSRPPLSRKRAWPTLAGARLCPRYTDYGSV
jgi:hypothetical protein